MYLTVWKVSRQPGKFPDFPEIFHTVQKHSRLIPDILDHGQCEHFLVSLESFQTVWKVSEQPGKFLNSLERF